jgi:E3 Ubiquitin ligase
MAGLGIIIAFISLIVLVFGLLQQTKAKRVADAPFVSTLDAGSRGKEVASPKGAISAQGQVRCDQPVIAPMSGTPSLWYKIKVTANWTEGKESKSRELETQQAAASFSINDGTGEVWIDARKGGDFTPTLTRSETKGTGLIGGLTGQELVFGNHRIQPGVMNIGTKYTVREECLPVENRLYVCGVVGDRSITAPGWRNLLISNKTRDELFASATKNAKMMLMGGAGAFAVGMVLTILGVVFAPKDVKADTASTTSAAVAGDNAGDNGDTTADSDKSKEAGAVADTTGNENKAAAKPGVHAATTKPAAAKPGTTTAAATTGAAVGAKPATTTPAAPAAHH